MLARYKLENESIFMNIVDATIINYAKNDSPDDEFAEYISCKKKIMR